MAADGARCGCGCRQGVVASEGRIFISGGVIGLDMLTNLYIMSASIRNYEAIALTFSNVMRCDRTHVLEVLDKFPSTSATLRRTIIRHVFRSEIRSYSRAVVHMLTGKRSIHARLMGDPSGREQHYYDKVRAMGRPLRGASRQQRAGGRGGSRQQPRMRALFLGYWVYGSPPKSRLSFCVFQFIFILVLTMRRKLAAEEIL